MMLGRIGATATFIGAHDSLALARAYIMRAHVGHATV